MNTKDLKRILKEKIADESGLAKRDDWYSGRVSAFKFVLDLITPSPEKARPLTGEESGPLKKCGLAKNHYKNRLFTMGCQPSRPKEEPC
ncbi:hypothetical protein [Desulfobacter sp.]|uniref:hypothetical protein n=1 Tax=Desulfobacter sp. TaxID=2294 RepID=UPI003D0B1D68